MLTGGRSGDDRSHIAFVSCSTQRLFEQFTIVFNFGILNRYTTPLAHEGRQYSGVELDNRTRFWFFARLDQLVTRRNNPHLGTSLHLYGGVARRKQCTQIVGPQSMGTR